MRLISCHIENFGKLNDITISFDDPSGINVVCENNGWGKSTLATFIKVMFFGFDNEGRRNNVENERQHFKPWQGGVYGGQLIFEADGRTYIMSRTFGTKEKDDEFMLQDADTRLVSTNYTENIGEELFNIDRASFSRSIYISQNDCVTATTDSINAKLGNLTDNTDDLNNYETAAKKIADRLNSLSKTRKTGELYKQKEQIARLKQEIKSGETIDVSMEEILKRKNELHISYEALKAEQKQLQGRQKSLSEYKDVLVKKKEYEHLCEAESKKQKLYEEKKALFPARVPDGDEIDKYIALEYSTSVLKKNMDLSKPDDEENREFELLSAKFDAGIPKSAEVESAESKVNDMRVLRWNIAKSMPTKDEKDSLKRLEELFSNKVPTVEEVDGFISTWTFRSEKKNTLSSKKVAADMLKLTKTVNEQEAADAKASARKRNRKKKAYTVAIAVLLIIIAVIGLALYYQIPAAGIGIMVADIVAIVLAVVAAVSKTRSGADSKTTEAGTSAAADFADPLLKLQKEIADDEALIYKTEADMKQFLIQYEIPYEENSVISDLYRLKEDIKLYARLLEKSRNNDADRLKERYNNLCNEVDGFLQRYGFGIDAANVTNIENSIEAEDITAHYVNLIYKLKASADKYITLKNKKESYEKSYEEYKKNMETLRLFINEIKVETELEITLNSDIISSADITSNADTTLNSDITSNTGTASNINFLLHHIKAARNDYFNARSEYQDAVEDKNHYEMENRDVLDAIKNAGIIEEDASLAEIEGRLNEISLEIEKYHTNMASYDRQLDELQEKRDEVTDSENRLEELQELYDLNEKKLVTLQNTQKYLEQAKISLTAKYTKPVKEGFDKYFDILCDIESENYQLDANFNMSVIEQGLPRDTALLSTGYQDMVGICMRMALIDAMYQDEKPFVIFDDPFVNLDAEKTRGALQLLDMIAKEYQVVYFTCNESRR